MGIRTTSVPLVPRPPQRLRRTATPYKSQIREPGRKHVYSPRRPATYRSGPRAYEQPGPDRGQLFDLLQGNAEKGIEPHTYREIREKLGIDSKKLNREISQLRTRHGLDLGSSKDQATWVGIMRAKLSQEQEEALSKPRGGLP